MGFEIFFQASISHSLTGDIKGSVFMTLHLHVIMSPVAYLKKGFIGLSSFHFISTTYLTLLHQKHMCLFTTQISITLLLFMKTPFSHKMNMTACKIGQRNRSSIFIFINARLCLSQSQQYSIMILQTIT